MSAKAIDTKNLDTSFSPGEDFYHFANGGWLKNNPIPDEFSRYGSFDKLREDNREIVRNIIEHVAENSNTDNQSDEALKIAKLVGDFYNTGMNTELVEKYGFEPITQDLEQIEAIKDISDLSSLIRHFYQKSIPLLFYLYPSPDREDSSMIISNLHQGGMGLSEVEYYRNKDQRNEEIRSEYKKYISKMFCLVGKNEEEAKNAANIILSIETRLADAGMTRLELRDPHKTFNKVSVHSLEDICHGLDWNSLFEGFKIDTDSQVNIGQPQFFKELGDMMKDIDIKDWKVYLKWRLLNSSASFLSSAFAEAKFNFYGRYLSGKESMQPRWKRVTAATEDALGEAIGRLFVNQYFPPDAKERMLKLTENLREALRERISDLDWMTAKTKTHAFEKLDRIRVKIGYPDKWRSYVSLNLSNKSYYENYRDAAIFNLEHEMSKIGKPADKDEWHMTPQTVNAYYHPLLNEIVFPAGILQPPFFHKDADDAVNYGAIGVVIGHEMTHGFDDQGRKFDKDGNLNDWWSKDDANNFDQRSKVLEEQFNKIKISDDLFANGKLSLGENIADLGGINIAFHALIKAWSQSPPEKEIDGFTPQQRFFLAYAHIWANNIREKEKIRLTNEDVHSLGINRVNGPLPNVQEFLEAFSISEKDNMHLNEESRASIW
ncbi:MAG TPA: M13 family metallopeptidase [Bacteroidales bacterium]|nr:M13 family metallopeptidase [Bacteroidales bacterium]